MHKGATQFKIKGRQGLNCAIHSEHFREFSLICIREYSLILWVEIEFSRKELVIFLNC